MNKDLPNRFPSLPPLSLENQGSYKDYYYNLFAMYLLYFLGRYSVVLNGGESPP